MEPKIENEKIENEYILANLKNRINWSAIIGGTTIGLFSQILLGMLGFAMGLLVINPRVNIETGFTMGTVLYLVLITLFSVFIAAFATGRFAGFLSKNDSMFHGVVTLALLTIISLFSVPMGINNIPNALNYGTRTAYLPHTQQEQALPSGYKYNIKGQTTGAAAFMTPQQTNEMQYQTNENIKSLSGTQFITGLLALIVAVFGGLMGMKSRVQYKGTVYPQSP